MAFIQTHQLNIMMLMSGICLSLCVLTILSNNLSPRRKHILASLESLSMLLLLSDRSAYIYRGNETVTGYWMVRISNFLVFLLTLAIAHAFTLYLEDLLRVEGKLSSLPKRFQVCKALSVVSVALLLVSQFTGLYYTFDAHNVYHRASGYTVGFALPMVITLLQFSILVHYRKSLRPIYSHTLLTASVVPFLAAVIQAFTYGISLINMSLVAMGIIAFVLALFDMNEVVERAKNREIDLLQEQKEMERTRYHQTAEALAYAIDAKDVYTHGHSNRVAEYARKIASLAGKSELECEQVYFAGLLHDVGKIGVPDRIIAKKGSLTEEEYAQIRLHPVYGEQILSVIRQSPFLSVAAHYHHERYDGKGYPSGLKGEEIPEIARIIAVADAYDAMTSARSYHPPYPQQRVRDEVEKGIGTQFDPKFAAIMLQLIDADKDYRMKEHRGGSKIARLPRAN